MTKNTIAQRNRSYVRFLAEDVALYGYVSLTAQKIERATSLAADRSIAPTETANLIGKERATYGAVARALPLKQPARPRASAGRSIELARISAFAGGPSPPPAGAAA